MNAPTAFFLWRISVEHLVRFLLHTAAYLTVFLKLGKISVHGAQAYLIFPEIVCDPACRYSLIGVFCKVIQQQTTLLCHIFRHIENSNLRFIRKYYSTLFSVCQYENHSQIKKVIKKQFL